MGCLPGGIAPGLVGLVVGGGDDGAGDADVAVVHVVAVFHVGFVVLWEADDF